MKEARRRKLIQMNFRTLRDIVEEELASRRIVIGILQNQYDQLHVLSKGLENGDYYMFCYSINQDILSQKRSVTELEMLLKRINSNIKELPLVDLVEEKEKPKDRNRTK